VRKRRDERKGTTNDVIDSSESARLAYEAGLKALEQQERTLESLRSRAGSLTAAIAITTSFLGPRAFESETNLPLAFFGAVCFVISLSLGVSVLWTSIVKAEGGSDEMNQKGWVFRLDPGAFSHRISEYPGTSLRDWYLLMADDMSNALEANDRRMNRIGMRLNYAIVALFFELVSWVTVTALKS
jgi:hypothetical protein